MFHFEAKINQLVILRSDKIKTFIRAFATKPSPELQAKYGKIFGLIEIESTNPKINDLIDLIIEEIKNNLYFRRHIRIGEETLPSSEQFELALKRTNIAIAAFLEKQQIFLNMEKINAVIALSHNQDLELAVIGNVAAILFFNSQGNNFRIVNILQATKLSAAPPDPLKFFSQIISGHIRTNDVVFVSTANIMDYFSQEKIKNLLTGHALGAGMNLLGEMLEKIKAKESFAALTLDVEKAGDQNRPDHSIEQFDYLKAANKDSMRELIRTEEETAKLLTPSIVPEIKKITGQIGAVGQLAIGFGRNTAAKILNRPRRPLAGTSSSKSLPPLGGLKIPVKNILQPIKSGWSKTVSGSSLIISRPVWRHVSARLNFIFGPLLAKFKRLPKSSRILLVITVILSLLLIQSVIWLGIKQYYENLNEDFNQKIYEAEYKKNTADSSLIFRDENLARQQLIEANNLLANVNPSSKSQQERLKNLKAGIEESLQKLRHITVIADPVQIVNFANLDDQAAIADFIVLNRNIVYTQNLNNQAIYKANIENRTMSSALSPEANTGSIEFASIVGDNEFILLNKEKRLFTFNASADTYQPTAINIPDTAVIADLTSFKGYIYLLDTRNNQIYRYNKTINSYGDPRDWLKEAVNLAEAKSIAVDGSVYLLKSNGEISKLENGKTVDFSIKTIEPALNLPTKIQTTENSNYIYLLDPNNKRVVVINKSDGNLVAQYFSEAFNDLKDMIVNESAKQIYLLNNTSVYGIALSHLQ